jgi:hypothetical protein
VDKVDRNGTLDNRAETRSDYHADGYHIGTCEEAAWGQVRGRFDASDLPVYCGTVVAGSGHCKKLSTMFFAHQKVYERNLPPQPTQLTTALIRRRAIPLQQSFPPSQHPCPRRASAPSTVLPNDILPLNSRHFCYYVCASQPSASRQPTLCGCMRSGRVLSMSSLHASASRRGL